MIDLLTALSMLVFAVGAGFLGALFGIGGGTIIVPVLVAFFHVGIKEAIAAGIVAVVATSTAGGSRYVEQEITNVRLAMFLEVSTTAGALTGALLTLIAPTPALFFVLFALLLLLSVLQIAKRRTEAERLERGDFASVEDDSVAKVLRLSAAYYDIAEGREVRYKVRGSGKGFTASYLAGVASGLLGIGGGVLKVPVMNELMNVPIKAAVATSKFMIGVTASTAALLYFVSGLVDPVLVAPLVVGVMVGATIGTIVMNRIRPTKLKALFGLLLLYFAYLMLARGVRIVFGVALPGVP